MNANNQTHTSIEFCETQEGHLFAEASADWWCGMMDGSYPGTEEYSQERAKLMPRYRAWVDAYMSRR